MTNSPPSNVKIEGLETTRVLASGIDTLGLSLQVNWTSTRFFQLLGSLKELANSSKADEPVRLGLSSDSHDWFFSIKAHGKGGYEWMISNKECSLMIGNWMRPIKRPSIMADFRSEALWMHGPDAVVQRLIEFVDTVGGKLWEIKSSRTDVCVDVLLPEGEWTRVLEDQFVTRATRIDSHTSRGKLTGYSIGKGLVSARLYDKPEEIVSKSGKYWMYDIWGIECVPDGHVVIRIEFTFRRERLRDFKCYSWDDTKANLSGLWAYATRNWLRIVEDAKMHHTQQNILPWWDIVANGFAGAQGAEPLVRDKAISFDLTRNALQVVGGLTSIIGIMSQDESIGIENPLDFDSYLSWALDIVKRFGNLSDEAFTEKILRKQARYYRSKPNFQ